MAAAIAAMHMKRASFAFLVLAACGGCPWTDLSPIQSSASCLQLSQSNTHGDGSRGGCVDPDIVGTNTCADPLTIDAMDNDMQVDLTFQPGEAISFEVPLEVATYHPGNDDDRYDFTVSGTLGSQPVTITFVGSFHGGI